MLAAQKDMDAITDKIPDDAKPDPKIDAQLDGVAKKNGFASYDDYNTVVDNISLVLGGFDPATKKYVGTEAVIKAQIAQVQADKKMSAKDKKEALADLNEALKQPQPAIENKGNIDLVGKYYDKLSEALGEDRMTQSSNSIAVKKKPRRNLRGFCLFRCISASGAGAHPHHEAVVAQFGDLHSTPPIRRGRPSGWCTSCRSAGWSWTRSA